MNDGLSIGRPTQLDCVKYIVLFREAKIFGGVWTRVGIVERTFSYFGRTFTVCLPGPRALNSFTVDLQPCADLAQHLQHAVGDGAVGARPDIQQQVSIFADDIG